jgi:hypothetical protein
MGLRVKYPLFSSDFNAVEKIREIFSKNLQISNFMKIRPVGAELFPSDRQTDRQADMAKLIIAFSKSVEAANKGFGSRI